MARAGACCACCLPWINTCNIGSPLLGGGRLRIDYSFLGDTQFGIKRGFFQVNKDAVLALRLCSGAAKFCFDRAGQLWKPQEILNGNDEVNVYSLHGIDFECETGNLG